MRMNKLLLMGAFISFLLACSSTFASAMPRTGIGLQAELLPVLPTEMSEVLPTQTPVTLADVPNLKAVVSLEHERSWEELIKADIEAAVKETNKKLAERETALMANLLEEVGWTATTL